MTLNLLNPYDLNILYFDRFLKIISYNYLINKLQILLKIKLNKQATKLFLNLSNI